MAELKTRPTSNSVAEFIGSATLPQQRDDCNTLLTMMSEATGDAPTMWGTSIVGFGKYHYKYASGRSGDWFVVGFSPRKKYFSLYLAGGLSRHAGLLERLGKYTRGKSCLYIKRLSNVDLTVLRELIDAAVMVARELDKSG